MSIRAPFLPYDQLRGIAAEFLQKHHKSGEIPVPIERIIELELGLDIVPMPGLLNEFDVDAFITSDLLEIRVDQQIQARQPNRYRFSLAHELAHLLIHRDVFSQLTFSTIAEWKSAMRLIPDEEYAWIEWQAYSLGGLILVPPQPLSDAFADRINEAKRAGITLKDMDKRLQMIIESNIAKCFEVSREVITRRMDKDGLWDK
jgi:hypothetical protein